MKKILLLSLLSTSPYALATDNTLDQRGWIVGGGVGVAMLTLTPENDPGAVGTKDDVSLYTVFGGYNFTDWFGIEFDISQSTELTDNNTGLDADIHGTSFSPKFTQRFNDNLALYLRVGLQYLAYEQTVISSYDREITWNEIAPFFGAGLQYSFPSGVRIRLDYKHATMDLDRSENSRYGFEYYEEEIDITYKAASFTVHYQF